MAPEGFLAIKFGTDRSFTYQVGEGMLTGKYSVGSGDKVSLFYSKPVGGKTKHVHTFRLSDEELEITDEQGNSRRFRRAS